MSVSIRLGSSRCSALTVSPRWGMSIAAANDGGRWVFETSGTPFAFEDLSAYANRLKKRRLTAEMLLDYLRALGVPVNDEPDWSAAYLVEHG